MFRRCAVALLVLAGAWVVPAHAQVNLSWKFDKGEEFYTEDVQKTKSETTTSGVNQKVDIEFTTLTKTKVLERNPDESVVLERTIEKVKVIANLPGFDRAFKKLEGITLKIKLSPTMEIMKIDGLDEFLDNLAEDSPAGRQMKDSLRETLKRSTAETFGILPNKTVMTGDTWKRKASLPLGPLGTMVIDYTYTYEGAEANLQKVRFNAVSKFEPPKAPAGGLPFQFNKIEVKGDGLKGTFFVDAAKGKVTKSEMTMKSKINLNLTVNGMNVDMQIDQDINGTSKLLDGAPSAGSK
jgi:hypothetical protein